MVLTLLSPTSTIFTITQLHYVSERIFQIENLGATKLSHHGLEFFE